MASYYFKSTAGVSEERYAFFSGISVYIKETDKYELLVNTTRTESDVQAAGFSSISEQDYLDYTAEISDFARIGGHPPAKP